MQKEDYSWSRNRLAFLMERVGISEKELSEKTGVSVPSIANYMNGRGNPTVANIIKLADFFNIPMDFLIGRCSEDEENLIKENFYRRYAEGRKELFEKHCFEQGLESRPGTVIVDVSKIERPWPYNLMYDTCGEIAFFSKDHEAGLNEALSRLSSEERDVIISRYKNGISLREIGDKYGVTRERIRQIEEKTVKKLSVCGTMDLILYGAKEAENRKKEAMLNKRKASVRIIPLEKAGLSNRSYHALIKAGADTVGDLIDIAEKREAGAIPYIGTKSEAEIYETARKFLLMEAERKTA